MSGKWRFALHPDIDRAALAGCFAEHGHCRIEPLLAGDGAAALHTMLRGRDDWRQLINQGDKLFELDRPAQAALSEAQRADLDRAVYAGAREGFQYRYESIRVPDDAAARAASTDPLARFAEWMSGAEVQDLVAAISGRDDIAFADAQATAYSPGDFLTGHDDDFAGKHRRCAYVAGFTAQWRIEWGGLLLFHGRDGAVRGCSPGFNTLDLFAVPQMHSVTEISRAAANRRYAITGWMRARSHS